MTTLKNVITALQREIDDALNGNPDASLRTRLVADKVILNLEVAINETNAADGSAALEFAVSSADSDANSVRTHTLTIEFKSVVPELPPASTLPSRSENAATVAIVPVRLEGSESGQIIAALSSVFGAPGFDSSARATVFREVFSELDPAQVSKLIASFSGASSAEEDRVQRSAIQRINGILRSGPQRSLEEGRKILAHVFSRRPPQPILKLIEENWKTQEDWLHTPMPATKPEQA